MSNIRVTYSGLISFAVNLISVITGFGYIVIVTRILSTQEYGTWGLITSLLVYGVVFTAIPVFWLLRETARELKSEKTGIVSSAVWSVVGILIYILIIFAITPQADVDFMVLLFAVILIPADILPRILSAINLGWKPQLASYGMLVGEILKFSLALLFVFYMDFGVIGVILAFFFAQISNAVFQIILARKRLQGYIKFSIIKNWVKLSWLPMYPKISFILQNSDIVIITIITGSVEIIAYYAAAFVIANIISYSAVITHSVNPKLLGGGKTTVIIKNLTYSIYFAVPLLLLSIVFAEAGLIVLNPVYKGAALVVIFLAFRRMFMSYGGVLESYLTGVETVDIKKNATIKDYLKSKLFTLPTFRIIQYSIFLLILSIVLILTVSTMSEIELVIIWSVIAMTIHIPLFIYLILKVRNTFEIKFETMSVSKYIIVGVCTFGFLSLLVDKFLILSEKLVEIVPNVLLFVSIGIGLYVLITYIIDSNIRNLLNGIVKELNQRKRG